MRLWAKKIAVILATGYVLFFYSERVFWSFLRPGDKFLDLVLGWLVYSLLGWVFLLLVRIGAASLPSPGSLCRERSSAGWPREWSWTRSTAIPIIRSRRRSRSPGWRGTRSLA